MGRASLRSGVVLALVIVALAQVLVLLQGVRSVRRLQARVAEHAERRVAAVKPRLDPLLARGGRAWWDEAAAVAIGSGAASRPCGPGSTRCSRAAAARAGTRPQRSRSLSARPGSWPCSPRTAF
jgi:hypothetical protein